MNIEDMDLSVRSYNCLKRAGIDTLEDIIDKTEEDMIKIRNLGRKNLEEIEWKLQEFGLSLKDKEIKYTDIIFSCRKCGHLLFVDYKNINPKYLIDISERDCPNCGEEGYENWVLVRAGNYNKEYGSK
jgi:hypothetical protein